MSKPYIYWKILDNNGTDIVTFYLEKENEDTKIVAEEELENVIGDYAEQREDEWTGAK